ncbi:jg22542, partial [Pararge aegeria aegeria]
MGESCYRLMTKNGQFIYMSTRGALEVDPTSKATTSFVCTNTLVPEKDGIELIRIMKNKFSLKINNEELKDECNYINPE